MRVLAFVVSVSLGSLASTASVQTPQSALSIQNQNNESLAEALTEVFVLSEELLPRFDELVARGRTVPDLIRDDRSLVYPKLLALRALHEELEHELELRKTSGVFSDLRGARSRLLETRTARIALSDFFSTDSSEDELRNLREWRAQFRAGALPGLETRSLAARRAWLESEARKLRLTLVSAAEEVDGAPHDQTIPIFPSVTSAGNLTGNGYEPGTWSLTFDDGPLPATTGVVLDNLKKHNLKASFFILSEPLQRSPVARALALRQLQEGHDVVSHSYNHAKITALGAEDRRHQIEDAISILGSVTQSRPGFFRLPYGAGTSTPAVRADLVKSCVVHVFWNVDTLDWKDKDPDGIENRTRLQMRSLGRGIILFHDTHKQSVIASERIMRHLNESNLEAIRVSDHVAIKNSNQKWSCARGW